MPEVDKKYVLQILFDKNQINIDDLQEKATQLIEVKDENGAFTVENSINNTILFKLIGTCEFIDTNHDNINIKLINKSKLNFIRITDELGDEIRCQLYPVIARVEHNLRLFINRALSEVLGFDWWTKAKFNNSIDFINNATAKKQSDKTPHHPLECLQLNDLVSMIDAKVCEWDEDKPLTASNIKDIFCNDMTLEDIKTYLKNKTTEKSYFDDVFKRYFSEPSKWNKVKGDLKFILNERHKVMHHRPIRYFVIETVKTKETNMSEILSNSKDHLTGRQLKTLNKNTSNIQELLGQWMLKDSPILADIQRISQNFQTISNNLQQFSPFAGISKMITQLQVPIGMNPELLKLAIESKANLNHKK